jgi:PEP-CTERM motif
VQCIGGSKGLAPANQRWRMRPAISKTVAPGVREPSDLTFLVACFELLREDEMKTRRSPLVLLTAAFCALSTAAALAEPIMYTFTAQGPITGTLGDIPIGGMTGDDPTDVIEFKFLSDTSDVTPFTAGNVHGWENLTGTATITVRDFQTSTIVAQGTFKPSDDMFVSIDNVNGGIGFGSGSSTFPGNPVYPFGIAQTNDPAINTYDLSSFHVFISSEALSCLGFPGACTTPTPLATTAGDLIFSAAGNQFDPADIGEFAANPFTITPPPLAPVPEPGTWALMAVGLVALGFKRRNWVVSRAA